MKTLLTTALGLSLLLAVPATATEVTRTYEFALDEWHEIDAKDGPVTLHRIRINPKESRVTRATVLRPFNHEHLSTVQIQLDYTNQSDRKWRAQVSVRWLDAEGRVIDGFTGSEGLEKRSANRVREMAVPTFKYGLEMARTLEVTINFEP